MNPDDSISDAHSSQHLRREELQSISLRSISLEPGLYVVATPIGNMADITLRALETLHAADHILAEDTRQSRKLLSFYNIKADMSAYHDHNAAKRIPKLIEDLKSGQSLALISDAGTPLVSDPGYKLVRSAIEAGIDVFPLPGASAVLSGLVKSGLPSNQFLFAGFLPPKTSARKLALQTFKSQQATLIFFETGPRIAACLEDIDAVLGERPIAITRELTKRFEEARYGNARELIESVRANPPKGEIVLLVGPPADRGVWPEEEVIDALGQSLIPLGIKRASTEIAGQSGWAKRDVYQLALKLKSAHTPSNENKN